MRYRSTRSQGTDVSLSDAIEQGLAPDQGLYVPEAIPQASPAALKQASSLPAIATHLLQPYFRSDALASRLAAISTQALNFLTPLKVLGGGETAVLELFHGPTAAFKDVGARFLAACLERIPAPAGQGLRTILVATSGDTGGAVASAFHGRPGIEVAVLFPKGGVSPLQQKQLTCWQGNVRSFEVRGSFDDCQRLVKAAFSARGTPQAIAGRHLTSANSINIGRLLPQMVYYAQACLEYQAMTGEAPGFVIPSGNLGNALAAVWAMQMGLPIREIVLATNANRVIVDFVATGKFAPAPSVKTLANAMDVGNPSNLERLIHSMSISSEIKSKISAVAVGDERIRQAIAQGSGRYGEIWCPHTAAAVHARELRNSPHWIVVATAHPAKFGDVVEPLIGGAVPMPEQLQALLKRPSMSAEIDADLEALDRALRLD